MTSGLALGGLFFTETGRPIRLTYIGVDIAQPMLDPDDLAQFLMDRIAQLRPPLKILEYFHKAKKTSSALKYPNPLIGTIVV